MLLCGGWLALWLAGVVGGWYCCAVVGGYLLCGGWLVLYYGGCCFGVGGWCCCVVGFINCLKSLDRESLKK